MFAVRPCSRLRHFALAAAGVGLAGGCATSDDPAPLTTGLGALDGAGQPTGTAGPTAPTGTSTNGTDPTGTSSVDGAESTEDAPIPTFDVGVGGDTGGPPCTPVAAVEAVCDGIDDDCNGLIDDIDVAGDGICDCLAIAIIGVPGALAASEFQQWLIDRGTSADRIDPAMINAAVLDAYDVVLLDQLTRAYQPAETAAFDAWVGAGGGLMAMTGHTSAPQIAQDWPNAILAPFGLQYQGALLSGPASMFAPHPITAGVTSVTFVGGFAIADTMPGTNEAIAFLAGGVAVGQVREHGSGKVFVWGDEWIEYDSQWQALPEITVLWTNIFDWLTPANLCTGPEG